MNFDIDQDCSPQGEGGVFASLQPELLGKWQEMLDLLIEQTGASEAVISSVEGGRVCLSVVAGQGEFKAGESQALTDQMCSGALAGKVPELSVDDFSEDVRWSESMGRKKGMRSFYGVPLQKEQGCALGLLAVYSAEPRAFNRATKRHVQRFQRWLHDDLMCHSNVESLRSTLNSVTRAHQELEDQYAQKVKEFRLLSNRYQVDIGKFKENQKALKRSQADFSSLVQNIPGIVYHCALDEDWTMHLISDDVEIITGYPSSDFIQNKVRTWASVLHIEDRQMVEDVVIEGVEARKTFQIEYRVVHKDGSVRWCYEQGKAVTDESGEVLWLNGVVLDITEKRKAEMELRKSERRGEMLKEVAVAANAGEKISEVLSESLDSVCAFTSWPVGHIFMPNSERTELVSTAIWHIADEEKFSQLREVTEKRRFPRGVGLPGRAWATASPYWSEDVTDDSQFSRAEVGGHVGVVSAFAFPILANGQVVAVMEFFSDQFQEEDVELLSVMNKIGLQLGIVLERKRAELSLLDYKEQLEEKVKQRTIDLEASNTKLMASLEVLRQQEYVMNQDLEMAKELQNRFLPDAYPLPDVIQFAGYYDACSSVGGDLYGVFQVSEHCVGFYIADVTGHGVSAAMVTAVLKVSIDKSKHHLEQAVVAEKTMISQLDFQSFMQELNKETMRITDEGKFVTFQLGVFDTVSGRLLLVNAGHNKPMLWRSEAGGCESIDVPANMPIGWMEDHDYEAVEVRLNHGDKFVAYTDGLTERANEKGVEFGEDRLLDLVAACGRQTPQEMIDALVECNRNFAGEAQAEDDVALLVAEYK